MQVFSVILGASPPIIQRITTYQGHMLVLSGNSPSIRGHRPRELGDIPLGIGAPIGPLYAWARGLIIGAEPQYKVPGPQELPLGIGAGPLYHQALHCSAMHSTAELCTAIHCNLGPVGPSRAQHCIAMHRIAKQCFAQQGTAVQGLGPQIQGPEAPIQHCKRAFFFRYAGPAGPFMPAASFNLGQGPKYQACGRLYSARNPPRNPEDQWNISVSISKFTQNCGNYWALRALNCTIHR